MGAIDIKLILSIIIFAFLFKKFFWRPKPGQAHLTVFFGIPGAGKTTVAAWYAKMYNKKKIPVYSNVAIKNTYRYDPTKELGKLKIQGPALVILDEASVEFNNRSWKSFPPHLIKWFKYHRHFSCELAVFSQDYADFDATIKRLTYRMFLLRKSKIPFFVKLIPIKRSIGINDQTKKPDDIYELYPWYLAWLQNRRIFAPLVWNNFNSWEQYDLPDNEWKKYDEDIFTKKDSRTKYWIKLWLSKAKTFRLKDLKKKKGS